MSPSTLALTSDTDSDSEPNTTHANVFWGHLKTPEKSRIDNDPPQTILRSKLTVLARPNESPTNLMREIPQNLSTVDGEKTDPSQAAFADSGLQEKGRNPELTTTASSAVSIVENANALGVKEPSPHSPIRSPENDRKNDNVNLTGTTPPNTSAPAPATPPSTRPSVSNIHSSELDLQTTPRVISPVKPTRQSPNPSSSHSTFIKALDKTPVKPANGPPHCLVSPSTPQVGDNSIRKERRMKLKNNEDRGRFQLLSLSPASTNVLNLVQSPLRNVDNKLTIPQSPVQKKAQRILVPALSRSPVKPFGLLRLPSPVKLDDPNRIPARRVPIPHSPLRTVQNDSLIYSSARRIPIIGGNKNMANHPDTPKQTADISMSTPFAPSDLLGHSHNIVSSTSPPKRSTELVPSAGPFTSSQRRLDPTRSGSAAKAGPSRLPILSARSVTIQPPSNSLAVRKRLDPTPAATVPSQIPSPAKPKTGNNAFALVSQTQNISPELKRKRAEIESEDELNERPHKRTTAETGRPRIEISQGTTGSIIQGTLGITHDPPKLASDKMETDEPTSLITKAEPSVVPNSHPRRTSRVRKSTTTPLKARSRPLTQTSARPLSSRTDSPSPSKLHARPPSRPPSRSASRSAYNLDIYPDNPRQLQWLTSHNTQRNQESVVELEHQTIRKFGHRPPSPSSRFRVDAKKSREEREARAERRQRRDRNNDGLISDVTSCVEATASSSNVTNQHKHMRAPGDDDDYETPVKSQSLDGVTKMVKWNRDLLATSGSESSEQQTRPKVKLKSCLLREPTTLALNFLGNVAHADEPLPDVVKEHIVISRFVYDDDIQEESPRRSKKKLV